MKLCLTKNVSYIVEEVQKIKQSFLIVEVYEKTVENFGKFIKDKKKSKKILIICTVPFHVV